MIVRKELSKKRHQYFTFLTGEGCEYVREYLLLRSERGEELTLDSPVLSPSTGPGRSHRRFFTSAIVGRIIRRRMREVGIPNRPYDLRGTFDTQLMLAESHGLMLRDYRAFFMGHKGDIEARYTTNRCTLPEAVVEDMRLAFARSQKYLQSRGVYADETRSLRDEVYRRLLMLAGYTEEEVDQQRLIQLSDEEFAERTRGEAFQTGLLKLALYAILTLINILGEAG